MAFRQFVGFAQNHAVLLSEFVRTPRARVIVGKRRSILRDGQREIAANPNIPLGTVKTRLELGLQESL
jgi:hypothetical protein